MKRKTKRHPIKNNIQQFMKKERLECEISTNQLSVLNTLFFILVKSNAKHIFTT